MTAKQVYLSLSLLGLMAYPTAGRTIEILPNVALFATSTGTGSISSPAFEQQPTLTSSQLLPVVSTQVAGFPADNFNEKYGVLLAYDPNDTSVNLSDQPNGNVITSLPNLTRIYADVRPVAIWPNSWNSVVVMEPDQPGYIWHELRRRTYYQVQDPQDTYANFRQSPNGPVLDTLPNSTEVRFIGELGTWTQVELAYGQTGYVATTLLTTPSCF